MPDAIARHAITTCEVIRGRAERGAEPFTTVGQTWLARLLAETAEA